MLYKACFLLVFSGLLLSCGKKKKTMAGADEVNLQEFVDFFPGITLPYLYADSNLMAKSADSLLISSEIFNQFTPDSVLKNTFPAGTPKIYAIGKFADKKGALYLLSKVVNGASRAVIVTAYNKQHQFLAGFAPMKNGRATGTSAYLNIDPLFNINRKIIKKLPNDIEISGDDVYVLNNAAKRFMLVMTDSLGDEAELINPIDTLGKKYKYAGDYGAGSRNIISIRDDIRHGRLQFFIHLEEKNSKCSGELKGEAIILSDKKAEYKQAGDPCTLQFEFENNSVTLKEVEGCGSRMGALDCTFNGKYPKKKSAKRDKSGAKGN